MILIQKGINDHNVGRSYEHHTSINAYILLVDNIGLLG